MVARYITVVGLIVLSAFTVLAEQTDTTKSYKVAKLTDVDQLALKKPEASSQVIVKEKYDYYDVDGLTPDELRAQMKRNGTRWDDGKIYAALTTWDIRYDYDIDSSKGKYFLSSIKTSVDITFHLPRLAPSAKTPAPLAACWNTYLKNLTKHEYGHRDIAVAIARDIYQGLDSLGTSSNRDELDEKAQKVIDAKLNRLKVDQVQYDAQTRHGEKQGAVLMATPSVPSVPSVASPQLSAKASIPQIP